jgi:disease resistance protein RPM1
VPRYLGLEGTGLSLLPAKILELQHLETLDLRRTDVRTLPVFKSMNLVFLLVDKIGLTEVLGEMKGLQEISMVHVGVVCNMLAKMVSQSKRLNKLGVIFAQVEQESDRKGLTDLLGVIANSNI